MATTAVAPVVELAHPSSVRVHVLTLGRELLNAVDSLRRDYPELRQMCPKAARQHSPLPDEQFPHAVKHEHRLLLGRLPDTKRSSAGSPPLRSPPHRLRRSCCV